MVLVQMRSVLGVLLAVAPLGLATWSDDSYDQLYYGDYPQFSNPVVPAVSSGRQNVPSHIFVFGDSLSDTGNAFAVNGMINPDPQYYHDAEKTHFGRFSNGKIWVDHLADLVRDSGVKVNNERDNEQFPRVFFGNEQVTRFIEDSQGAQYSNAIAVLWFGSNDIMQPFAQGMITSDESLQAVVDSTTQMVHDLGAALKNAGVQRVFYFNLPDFDKIINWRAIMGQAVAKLRSTGHVPTSLAETHSGFQGLSLTEQRQLAHIDSPYTRNDDLGNLNSKHEAGTKLGFRSLVANKKLLSKAADEFTKALQKNGIEKRDIFDIAAEFNRLYDGELRNSNTNKRFETSRSCLTQDTMRRIVKACRNPDSFLLWDEKHPTSAVHKVLATEFYTRLALIYTNLKEKSPTVPVKRPNAL
ncbi:hypothetical protein H4R35_004002 [Dimargaris xerosporica]|nr:hypothetical protein H4R35_004002 [Dimargaris xerosporica]